MEKIKKYGKSTFKHIWKIGAVIGGFAAVAGVPVTGSIAGIVAISSAVSAMVKDKNAKPIITIVMKFVNLFAVNVDKAENDKKINGVKPVKKSNK